MVDQGHRGTGHRIVDEVARRLRDLGASQAYGDAQEATLRRYDPPGDHKVVFVKQLQA